MVANMYKSYQMLDIYKAPAQQKAGVNKMGLLQPKINKTNKDHFTGEIIQASLDSCIRQLSPLLIILLG